MSTTLWSQTLTTISSTAYPCSILSQEVFAEQSSTHISTKHKNGLFIRLLHFPQTGVLQAGQFLLSNRKCFIFYFYPQYCTVLYINNRAEMCRRYELQFRFSKNQPTTRSAVLSAPTHTAESFVNLKEFLRTNTVFYYCFFR